MWGDGIMGLLIQTGGREVPSDSSYRAHVASACHIVGLGGRGAMVMPTSWNRGTLGLATTTSSVLGALVIPRCSSVAHDRRNSSRKSLGYSCPSRLNRTTRWRCRSLAGTNLRRKRFAARTRRVRWMSNPSRSTICNWVQMRRFSLCLAPQITMWTI